MKEDIRGHVMREYFGVQSNLERAGQRWAKQKWPGNPGVELIDYQKVWGYWVAAVIAIKTMETPDD